VTLLVTRSEAETFDAGRAAAVSLRAGDVLLISGPLGAGKTAYVRGLAAGLGTDPDSVSSPTFTIIQEYPGRLRLYHVDLYRLTPAEAADLGLEDLGEAGILAVEWPDRWTAAPAGACRIDITDTGGSTRRIVTST
jgi:tRNA threonylcarbamoyladenosine biosynthesis protein TsaE